ncbi:MAG: hypothetical protein LAN64_16655 [Acidobacteriia bacterium]|nr:hypothetical protein [Terriglobia bacterium]
MRILGLLFIVVGLILCFTVVFFMHGLGAIAVGALLYIAGRGEQPDRLAKAVQSVLAVVIGVVLMGGVFMWYGCATYKQRHELTPASVVQPAPRSPQPAKKHAKPKAWPAH